MLNSFSQRPRLDPYGARRPTVSFTEPNGADAPMAAESARQNIEQLDRVHSQVFNEAIWKGVRGADSEMPAPVTHLRTREEAEEEEGDEEAG